MPATEKPRAEPEIIPPGDLDGRPMRDRYHFDVHGGSQRIYVARLGPFGIVVLGLLIALITAVIPIVLLGALLIWIPVAVLFVAAAVVSGLLRGRDSVPPSPAEAPASPPLAETTDAVRDERASQLVDRLSLWSGAAGLTRCRLSTWPQSAGSSSTCCAVFLRSTKFHFPKIWANRSLAASPEQ
jgi:hypothetical protein